MEFDRTQSAGYLGNVMARLLTRALHMEIEAYGLAPAQFMTMVEIWRDPGVTQRLLVDRLGVEQGTMTNTLARMERDGFIVRRPHETDGRAQTVHLTQKAEEILQPTILGAIRSNEAALGCLTDTERQQFLDLMQKVIECLRAHVNSAANSPGEN